MISKSSLAVFLSKLKVFDNPKVELEQYSTPSEIAASMLWIGFMNGDIESRVVCDYGAGTGILGIGAMILGAERVTFVEKDKIELLKENLSMVDVSYYDILHDDISVSPKSDTVIMNPPFGTKNRHIDRYFLEIAFKNADNIYSIHKTSTLKFIEKFASENGFKVVETQDIKYPLKKTMKHHIRDIKKIDASIVVMKRGYL